jgi:hypothetical protein
MSSKPIKERLCVPISFEYLLTHLFGKQQYHGYVGAVRASRWKRDMLKVLKYLRRSILLTVSADNHHKKQLLKTCDETSKLLDEASTINGMNVALIEGLTKLSFRFVGNLPDHWRRKSPYRDRFWELNGHRSITYVQTDEQRAGLLIYLVDIRKLYKITLTEYEDLHEAFYRGFKGNPSGFLDWFRNFFPKVYSDVF